MPDSEAELAANERPNYSSPSVSNVDSDEGEELEEAVASDQGSKRRASVNNHSAGVAINGSKAGEHNSAEDQHDMKDDDAETSKGSDEDPGLPPKVHRGLLVEDPLDALPVGDLVIIHGLNATSWYLDAVPEGGCRGSTAWLFQKAGFIGWQFLSYFYPLNSTDTTRPAPFYKHVIEDEALLLLEGIVAYRDKLKTRYEEKEVDERPIAFAAHDIGGTIVKKALTIAALNPAKYGDIAYCGSCIIFLGCPHRSTSLELQDTLTKLIYMPENKWQPATPEGVKNLAEAVEYTNGEFYDTNVLIRASVFNIYNSGTVDTDGETRVQAPFHYEMVILDTPWECFKPCQIPHDSLVEGGHLDEGTSDEHFAQAIQSEKSSFPTAVASFWGREGFQTTNFHKMFLAMAPPMLPAQPTQFRWQPYLIEGWFVGQDAYKDWSASPGIGILHAHGNANLAIKSQELYAQLQGRELIANMMYFEFRRHDCRFNTLEALLRSFIAHIITRVPQRNANRDDYYGMMPLLWSYEAISLTDLMHIFRSMLMWRHIPPLVFMIACLDECDANKHRLLGLIYSLRECSEMRHRFFITSLPEEGLLSRLQGNYRIDLDSFDTTSEVAWTDTFEKCYELHIGYLSDNRPVFKPLLPHVREILASCGTDYRLGHLIIRWLVNKATNPGKDTKLYAQRLLDSLEPVSADRVLNTIIRAFGPDVERARTYLDWVTVARRPLSLLELGTAVEFTESPTPETLEYLDFQYTRIEVQRFGLVFVTTDNVVDFWLPYYLERMHYDELELDRANGRIAEVCLDYLLMETVQNEAREFCCRFQDPYAVVPFAPKDSLLSYAVQFWPEHYSKAGSNKPFEKAMKFFQNTEARSCWWWMLQLLVSPVYRCTESFLSALPYVAFAGLEDLFQAQLEMEADSINLKDDAGIALALAALGNNKTAMAMAIKHTELTKQRFVQVINLAAVSDSPECVEEILRQASEASLEVEVRPSLLCRTIWIGWKHIMQTLHDAAVAQGADIEYPVQPLHLSVEHGDECLVQTVISWIDDINSRDTWGRTALHLAATAGDPAIIRLLISKGADIEAKLEVEGRGSLTPLQLATASGNHLALDVLLQNGAQLNIGSSEMVGGIGGFHEAPPIIYAAGMGFLKCVKVLLQHQPDLNMKVNQCSALWYAIDGERLEISRLLLEAGGDPNENPDNFDMLLFMPIRSQNHELLDLLLEHKVDVNQESSWDTSSRTPLARAASGGDLEIVKKLLGKGADPNLVGKDSQSPLYLAAFESHEDIVSLLLERGANVNQPVEISMWTPLHAAYDNKELLQKLLEAGANIDALSDAGTVLYLAAKHNQIEVVDFLVERKASIDIGTKRITANLSPDEFGMTPLCIACMKSNVDVVRSLLQAGADVNYMCKSESTGEDWTFPLKLCMERDNELGVEALLSSQSTTSSTPDVGLSAGGTQVLHCISGNTPLSVVKILVAAGADVNAIDSHGLSPLMIAMDCMNISVATYLIAWGANVNHFTPDQGAPLHIACRKSEYKLFKSLIDNGAEVARAEASGYHSTLLGVLCSTETEQSWDAIEKIAKYLVEEAKVDPNERCRKRPSLPLCRAAREGPEELVRYLLAKGADVNAEDAWGIRPIHYAAWFSWEMYTIIIQADGLEDDFPKNKLNMTPLHYAVAGRIWNDGFDKLLEKHGASVHDKDVDGWDAVMWMAKGNYSDPETLEAILRRANHDALWIQGYVTGDRRWSPLKCARYYGSTDRIYEILTPSEDKRSRRLESGEMETWDDKNHEAREAHFKDRPCNMCFNRIYGFAYRCSSCDVHLCYKCNRSKEIFDPGHDYEEIGPEYDPAEGEEDAESNTSEGGKPEMSGTSDLAGTSDAGSDVSADDSADDEASMSSFEVESNEEA